MFLELNMMPETSFYIFEQEAKENKTDWRDSVPDSIKEKVPQDLF